MKSVYRQLKEVESERKRANRGYLRAAGGSTDTTAYRNMNEMYDREEREIIEKSLVRIPVFEEMMDSRRYLEKKQDEYGLPRVIRVTGRDKRKRKLNRELKDVLGIRPLSPSYIPCLGVLAGGVVGALTFDEPRNALFLGVGTELYLNYLSGVVISDIRDRKSEKRMDFILDIGRQRSRQI